MVRRAEAGQRADNVSRALPELVRARLLPTEWYTNTYSPARTCVSDCQTTGWDKLGLGGGRRQDHIWCAPMILRLSMPRHRLFFQPCAGRIRKMEGSGAHAASGLTQRASIGRLALNLTPGRRRSRQPRSNQTPGKPFIPHRRRQRRLHRLSRSGTRPSVSLVGEKGVPKSLRCLCRRCQSTGRMTAVWPEHSGDSLTFWSPARAQAFC